ncbi:MAG TPA: VWA domain-containing protein [Pyrinomonadaceae bacterium]|nr:VWA domain-containing protein [Pyrinomonadaceae bacterium]
MKNVAVSLFLLISTAMFAQVAKSQGVPPASKNANGARELGEAPEPPRLRKPQQTATDIEKQLKTQAAEPEQADVDENDIVRVSTSLITVPAEVLDRTGRNVGNLRKEDFQLYENGVEQQVSYFGSIEQPFTVALLLDVSGSTQTRLQAIRAAANAFITRLRPNDQLLIVSFDGKINFLTEAVKIPELRKRRFRLDAVNDGTLLYDTVDVVLNQRLKGIRGRKAIVLLTDGVDQGSKRASRKQNLHDAYETDVLIYTVQYNTLPQLPERLSRIDDPKVKARIQSKMEKEYAIGSAYLSELAAKTGGRLYNADSLGDLQQSFGAITEELGRQYSLGYYPKGQARPGERRDIKVRVRAPNLVVRARDSYIANGRPPTHAGRE